MKKISAIVTFHNEGLLAHTALLSYARARAFARKCGCDVQFVLVMDKAKDQTREIVETHPSLDGTEEIISLDVGDLALARNGGMQYAKGSHIATLDGDDLISESYFNAHMQAAEENGQMVILHPEMVVSFGKYNAFNWQVDQGGEYFDRPSLLTINPWISAAFASSEVFERVPYEACYPHATGFGFEDWYWNCETIAAGFEHRLAWGSVYFYRRKHGGSLNEASQQTIMPRSRLFDEAINQSIPGFSP